MTVSTHTTGLPPAPAIRRISEYVIEVHNRDMNWGALHITAYNHPNFSYRIQDLTLAVRGGGFKGKLQDIEVYMWLDNVDWHLEGDALIDRLKEILV